ncbi:MAG: 3'(2'),5'-bisphosphate nucleotidase CysQ [Acidobacteria bacterium]|nr:MAG: 3'(2'),5'-bisphosphate nucleotidase CysQ [Acidobacteriota bacterium]
MESSLQMKFAVDAVRRAGAAILSYFRGSYELKEKSKGNPVTSADLAADALLREAFARDFPEDGWLSEETADSADRLARQRVWVVDPLDGTKEFVRGRPEFATSVALVEGGAPRLAVVYNPARDELFTAEEGKGAWQGATRLRVSTRARLEGAHILASRSEVSARFLGPLRDLATVESIGSVAYKLALVAAGRGDLTLSVRPKSEWDLAAGVLLVGEAGGIATDVAGDPMLFNRPEPRIAGVLAANPELARRFLRWADSKKNRGAIQ